MKTLSHDFPQTKALSDLREIATDSQFENLLQAVWLGMDLYDAVERAGLIKSRAILIVQKISRELKQYEKENAE